MLLNAQVKDLVETMISLYAHLQSRVKHFIRTCWPVSAPTAPTPAPLPPHSKHNQQEGGKKKEKHTQKKENNNIPPKMSSLSSGLIPAEVPHENINTRLSRPGASFRGEREKKKRKENKNNRNESLPANVWCFFTASLQSWPDAPDGMLERRRFRRVKIVLITNRKLGSVRWEECPFYLYFFFFLYLKSFPELDDTPLSDQTPSPTPPFTFPISWWLKRQSVGSCFLCLQSSPLPPFPPSPPLY